MQWVAWYWKMFYIRFMKRRIEILDKVSKVEFCQVAGISRPTLYKYLRGDEVIPAIELAIIRAATIIESRQQPAPAA